MILKTFELNKLNLKKNNLFLFYGENQGYKNEIILEKFKKFYLEKTYTYEENEILNNKQDFFNNILSKSFFENEKLIIITRVTDKILNLIQEVYEKKIDDIVIILNASILDKKSKVRSFFEKDKNTICVPFYEDNNQTLSGIVNRFFRENKIPISQQGINIIAERCRGDRQNLKNELQKIENFVLNKKKIDINEILKITNLAENYSVTELVDNCLAKNKKRTINILNENNYSIDDCILIIRTFLIKSKRLLKLSEATRFENNADQAISMLKPPIFWKDKDIVKQQVKSWSNKNVKLLIYKISEIELLIKKNSVMSTNLLSDFIIEQASISSN
ncbi:DNA polymerase III subunit delta [Candidatus Pelagibacter sp.]|nr:DNA polymerase III subunit delta [Candidatus Pelagibacter sp.]